MYDDGYQNLVNIDYAETVIRAQGWIASGYFMRFDTCSPVQLSETRTGNPCIVRQAASFRCCILYSDLASPTCFVLLALFCCSLIVCLSVPKQGL